MSFDSAIQFPPVFLCLSVVVIHVSSCGSEHFSFCSSSTNTPGHNEKCVTDMGTHINDIIYHN
jgi:hypothetical protein